MSNINFACTEFPIDKIIKCSFGLSKGELTVLQEIFGQKEISVEDLSEKLGKDRTTIQRSIGSLYEKNLVKRRQINLSNGGYQFLYKGIPKSEIIKVIKKNLDNFNKLILMEIENW